MVPTFTCGFVLSNFCFAKGYFLLIEFLTKPILDLYIRVQAFSGAHDQIRTDGLALTKGVLCQLSYVGRSSSPHMCFFHLPLRWAVALRWQLAQRTSHFCTSL